MRDLRATCQALLVPTPIPVYNTTFQAETLNGGNSCHPLTQHDNQTVHREYFTDGTSSCSPHVTLHSGSRPEDQYWRKAKVNKLQIESEYLQGPTLCLDLHLSWKWSKLTAAGPEWYPGDCLAPPKYCSQKRKRAFILIRCE